MFNMRANWSSVTSRVEDLAARVEDVEQDASFFDDRLADVEFSMVTAQNASVFAEKDYRCVMLGGDPILQYFQHHGADGVRRLLADWSASFRQEVDPESRDWMEAISHSQVFVIPFP